MTKMGSGHCEFTEIKLKLSTSILLISLTLLHAAYCVELPEECGETYKSSQGQFPPHVYFQNEKSKARFSGTLITKQHVLLPASLVYKIDDLADIKAYVVGAKNESSKFTEVLKACIMKEYQYDNQKNSYNLALLKLANPNIGASPACLPRTLVPSYVTSRIPSFNGAEGDYSKLTYVDTEREVCAFPTIMHRSIICFKARNGGDIRDMIKEDSLGSGVYIKINGKLTIMGSIFVKGRGKKIGAAKTDRLRKQIEELVESCD